MHPAISTTFKILGLLLVAMILVVLLPLGASKLPITSGIVLTLGLGCFWIVSLAYLHGQIVWRTGTFHLAHHRFHFCFYLLFYVLAGLVCVVAGIGGLLA
jgi:hypothetical protein